MSYPMPTAIQPAWIITNDALRIWWDISTSLASIRPKHCEGPKPFRVALPPSTPSFPSHIIPCVRPDCKRSECHTWTYREAARWHSCAPSCTAWSQLLYQSSTRPHLETSTWSSTCQVDCWPAPSWQQRYTRRDSGDELLVTVTRERRYGPLLRSSLSWLRVNDDDNDYTLPSLPLAKRSPGLLKSS